MAYKSNTTNETLKYNEIDPSKITVEITKLGKDEVPLIRYNGKNLIIQGPTIKLSSYGLPPGKLLGNGAQNEYYISEEARDFLKIPLDPENTNVDGNDKDISEFIELLKAIDTQVKNSTVIKTCVGIDEEDFEKYMPLFKKPKSNKKKEQKKDKMPYFKAKLDINYNDKQQILTEFYNVETKERVVTENNYILISDLEKELIYNTQITPVIQLVKIWTQSKGDWGITLKLKKLRFKKPQRAPKMNFDFIDDEESNEENIVKKTESINITNKVNNNVKPKQVAQVESDSESDDPKPVKANVTKKVAQVESDGSDSEPEPQPVKVTKKSTKKVAQVESDGSDSEPEPVKISTNTKVKSTKK